MNGEVAVSFFATSNKIFHNFHGKQWTGLWLPWDSNGGTCMEWRQLLCNRKHIYIALDLPHDCSGMPNRVRRWAIIAQDGRYACALAGNRCLKVTPTWRRRRAGRAPPYIISRREALCSPCVQTCPSTSIIICKAEVRPQCGLYTVIAQ